MSDPAERLERIYGRYGRSRRRRRAWAADNPGNVAIREELFECVRREIAAQEVEGDILDIGCGGGWLLARLAESGVDPARLHGVELIESRVSAARRAVPDAEIRAVDARMLPFETGSLGLVLLLTVLSSMPDAASVQRTLTEARRVLTPGGLLLVYEPRLPNPFNRATRRISREALQGGLGDDWRELRLTVAPPLARRVNERVNASLRRFGPLLTHRLVVYRKPLEAPAAT